MSKRLLTKSLFKTGVTCPRKLRYATNELYPRDDTNALGRSLIQGGRRFEDYCRVKHYSDGVKICKSKAIDDQAIVDEMVERTRVMLMDGDITLFEAAVRDQNFFVRPDVLQRSGNTLSIIEIKTKAWTSNNKMVGKKGNILSTFLPYIQDVAFQKLVVQRAFPDFPSVKAYLMMPNKEKRTELTNLQQLVMEATMDHGSNAKDARDIISQANENLAALIDVSDLADSIIDGRLSFPGSSMKDTFEETTELWATSIQENVEEKFIPPPIGPHCKACEYRVQSEYSGFDTCWEEATGLDANELAKGHAVIDLWNTSKKDLISFLANQKYRLSDLTDEDLGFNDGAHKEPDDLVSGISRRRRQLYQSKGMPTNKKFLLATDYLREEMDKWQFPLSFIDFETIAPVLPYFKGMAPYELIAFQFSHHMLHEDGRVTHASQFLNTDSSSCPNEAFLIALKESIIETGGGSVFRWGSHENTVLASLLRHYPNVDAGVLQPLLNDGEHAMVDLLKVATEAYFISGSHGSSSIKRLLLPTLEASSYLENFYGNPSYTSSNFKDMQWFQKDDHGKVSDPYNILLEQEPLSAVADGGGAMEAYNVLQCHDISVEEQCSMKDSLLRYCELDTLAMTMIVQAWQGFLSDEK